MPTNVPAHITGTLWKIEKKVGDEVAEGDTIVILESMKMEMPIEAPVAGKIASIAVKEGEPVDEGKVVAVIAEGMGFAGLARSVRGGVLPPGAPGYDEARRGFDFGADGRPAIIVRCAEAGDAEVAVRLAADAGLSVAVRGGGHGLGGPGMASGAVAIDLARLDQIEVDAAAGVATVG